MSLCHHLRKLFTYDDWANREVLDALKKLNSPPSRPLQFLAHIFAAERIWLERLRGVPQSVAVWPEFTLEQCAQQAEELPRLWKQYLSGLNDEALSARITYHNSKGERWESGVEDVLTHVVMHSAYHRGQIATDLRAAGFTPPYTDYIHPVRQGLLR